MQLTEWQTSVPAPIRSDSLWTVEAYRLALFVADAGWDDVSVLAASRPTLGAADQLHRVLGSVHANIAEGYSRRATRDRARFYEYALGSAREAASWYYHTRRRLATPVLSHRLEGLERVRRLLLTMLADQRRLAAAEQEARPRRSPRPV